MATSPPRNQTPPSFVFPPYTTRQLSNGMTVLIVPDSSQPLVSLSVAFKCGAAAEPVWGAANFMTSLLTKGTTTRTTQMLADAIDFTGGTLSASCGYDSTSGSLSVLSEYLPTGLELLADVVQHPAFAADEIERLRQQTLVEVQQHLSDAGYLAAVAWTQGMFGGTRYGHPTIGTVATVQVMSREDCTSAYERLLRPEQAFIAAAGDVDADSLCEELERLFGSWTTGTSESGTTSNSAAHEQPENKPPPSTDRRVMLIEKPDAAQTAIRVGFPTAERTDEDFIAVQFLNTILGGSFISRLNHNLREEKGYTYGIHSAVDTYKEASVWVCRSHVGSEIVDDAVSEILREVERMHTEPISDDELETTRKYLLGSFALRTETPTQVVSLVSALEMFHLPSDYYERYFAEIASMTKDRLFEVQQRRFGAASTGEGLVIAASGNVQHLRTKLGKFGAVSIVKDDCSVEPAV